MSNPPRITVGMTEAKVEQLLGKPTTQRGGGDLMKSLGRNVIGAPASISALQYALYEHSAGTYQIVFNGGAVVEVNSQPGS